MYGEAWGARQKPVANSAHAKRHYSKKPRPERRSDYRALEELAADADVDVAELAERFEGGETVRQIRASLDTEWIRGPEAEHICPGIYEAMRRCSTPAVRRKPNSSVGRGARGAGWLWYRPDVERVWATARECRLKGVSQAIRVLDAMHRGAL